MSALALRLEDFGRPQPFHDPGFTQADLDAAHEAGRRLGEAAGQDLAGLRFSDAVADLAATAADREQMMREAHAQALSDLARLAHAVMQAALPELQSRLTARLLRRELDRLAQSAGGPACTVTGDAALLARIAAELPEDRRDMVRLDAGEDVSIRLDTGRLDIDAGRFCDEIISLLQELIERNDADERA
ncbi:MAG: hypothetical protein Q4G36_06395 [Paracoccus sp. (in: a-proteobacteria)]|nr:hypothetical protein [Paracoccus sp. (in: a-proteobacteria)]